ncbi:MAG: hypothetical protein EBR09_09005 [Proteobacteria bacterium]|nr:hypothetical protein [Pseudomonadota bacterium]
MRFCAAVAIIAVPFSVQAHAAENAKASLALGGLSLSREKLTTEQTGGSSKTSHITAVDLFGYDGQSALPALEFAFSMNNVVVYAYPNAPAGGRELWVGLKTGDATEVGFAAGTNHLVFSPAGATNIKTKSSDRVGLFVNHRLDSGELSFDLNINPSYTISTTTLTDSELNTVGGKFSVAADALWVWEIAENIELNSGVEFYWSQTQEKTGGKKSGTADALRFGFKLAETRFYL